mmetsp:Transcript_6397/g.24116  ORF Transcript_6397/g.24116 Transcript_6397/m.24116 type:complete len:233 (+) Transcript_6397:209-907(+)
MSRIILSAALSNFCSSSVSPTTLAPAASIRRNSWTRRNARTIDPSYIFRSLFAIFMISLNGAPSIHRRAMSISSGRNLSPASVFCLVLPPPPPFPAPPPPFESGPDSTSSPTSDSCFATILAASWSFSYARCASLDIFFTTSPASPWPSRQSSAETSATTDPGSSSLNVPSKTSSVATSSSLVCISHATLPFTSATFSSGCRWSSRRKTLKRFKSSSFFTVPRASATARFAI